MAEKNDMIESRRATNGSQWRACTDEDAMASPVTTMEMALTTAVVDAMEDRCVVNRHTECIRTDRS